MLLRQISPLRRLLPLSAATPRSAPDPGSRSTPRGSQGSIALKGARIDDLSLVQFRDTVDPVSPAIVLFSPSGTAEPYYAEFGWVGASGANVKIPDQNTPWQQEGSGSLTPTTPITLKFDNGEGLSFRRTISIDDRYLFSVKDEVTNISNTPVTLYPFALISRHGTPKVAGYYILHEGLIGYLGDKGLAGIRLQENRRRQVGNLRRQGHQRLARHHGQVLGVGLAAGHQRRAAGALLIQSGRHGQNLSDRLSGRSANHRHWRHRNGKRAAVRRRQGSQRGRHQFSRRRPWRIQQSSSASTTSIS